MVCAMATVPLGVPSRRRYTCSVTRTTHDPTTTISAKVPLALASQIDRIAHYGGVSRSSLIRELAEDGETLFQQPSGFEGFVLTP